MRSMGCAPGDSRPSKGYLVNIVQECVELRRSNAQLLAANEKLKKRVLAAEAGHIKEERVTRALLLRIEVLKTEIEMLRAEIEMLRAER